MITINNSTKRLTRDQMSASLDTALRMSAVMDETLNDLLAIGYTEAQAVEILRKELVEKYPEKRELQLYLAILEGTELRRSDALKASEAYH